MYRNNAVYIYKVFDMFCDKSIHSLIRLPEREQLGVAPFVLLTLDNNRNTSKSEPARGRNVKKIGIR